VLQLNVKIKTVVHGVAINSLKITLTLQLVRSDVKIGPTHVHMETKYKRYILFPWGTLQPVIWPLAARILRPHKLFQITSCWGPCRKILKGY